ncbi:MAG: FAD-binding protein, partial [bacterium]|nr:FAD-binding protein [bacterium]
RKSEKLVHFDSFFYPLDKLRNWNRLYGRSGFLQYQFVLPKEESYRGLRKILEAIQRSGQGSPLAVLKLLGKADPNCVMSFPMSGYTLAIDFKISPLVFVLLDSLDKIVMEHGGRIYLAKDARMSPAVFNNTYKRRVDSGQFRSLQAKRLEF